MKSLQNMPPHYRESCKSHTHPTESTIITQLNFFCRPYFSFELFRSVLFFIGAPANVPRPLKLITARMLLSAATAAVKCRLRL